jgi:hypothetical protein
MLVVAMMGTPPVVAGRRAAGPAPPASSRFAMDWDFFLAWLRLMLVPLAFAALVLLAVALSYLVLGQ